MTMRYDALISRLEFVVYGAQRWRLTVSNSSHGKPMITYDAHGQTVSEVRQVIRNIVNISRCPINLCVIHGYNHGTAIKDMLAREDFSERLETKYNPSRNPGETILFFAA